MAHVFLGPSKLPTSRIIYGLWQTSGGWGSASEAAAVEAIAVRANPA
jgi:hypothetical protein